MRTIKIRIPASTANIGPGFDCLGIALQIYNIVTISEGAVAHDRMASEAASTFFRRTKIPPFTFNWQIEGDVPRSRGLGSSVTVRLGLLYGLNELAGCPLNREELFHLCSLLEGHPDNAAAAAFGGFTIARPQGKPQRYPVSANLKFVVLIPGTELNTVDSRSVLPKLIPHADAVVSAANAAAIAAAFASERYGALAGAFVDRLHQPYRVDLVPFFNAVIDAGREAGALGGWLSGSGSAIVCVTERSEHEISQAMLKAIGPIDASSILTRADNQGVVATV